MDTNLPSINSKLQNVNVASSKAGPSGTSAVQGGGANRPPTKLECGCGSS